MLLRVGAESIEPLLVNSESDVDGVGPGVFSPPLLGDQALARVGVAFEGRHEQADGEDEDEGGGELGRESFHRAVSTATVAITKALHRRAATLLTSMRAPVKDWQQSYLNHRWRSCLYDSAGRPEVFGAFAE